MRNYFTIKAFKCPNGYPPEECGHVQQIIINLANYYKNKKLEKKTMNDERAQSQHHTKEVQSSQNQQRIRRRG